MFYVFIFESIGTSELMLIGLVALIVFGPRKLPEIARTIGKTMAEFRRSTDDFKQTWHQEIESEVNKKDFENLLDLKTQNKEVENQTISRSSSNSKVEIAEPEIKVINADAFDEKLISGDVENIKVPEIEKKVSDKRDWL